MHELRVSVPHRTGDDGASVANEVESRLCCKAVVVEGVVGTGRHIPAEEVLGDYLPAAGC